MPEPGTTPPIRRRGTTARRRFLVRHLVPAVATVVWLLPLFFLVIGSLRPAGAPPPAGLDLVPDAPTLDAFRRLDDLLPVWTFARNSLLVTVLAVPLTVAVAALAGFGVRLLSARRARMAVVATLVVMLVPVTAVWATRFELFRLLGLVDTYVPLVAPALMATNPFYVLVYAWAFSRIPEDQLDAARLDGANMLQMLRRVALPQVRPATLAVVVLAATFHWSNFIDALLYLNSLGRFTLPLGLRFLQQLGPTEFPLLLAGSLVFTIPVAALLLLAQRVLFEDPSRIVRRG